MSEGIRDGVACSAGISAVILAGGRGSRMGGVDKGLIEVAGTALIDRTLTALRPQVCTVLINANRNREAYARRGCPVLADATPDYDGPLAGMAAALAVIETPWLLAVPCDCPQLAPDLAARLLAAAEAAGAELAVAHDGERLQPVFVLLHRDLRVPLAQYLDGGGRKLEHWYRSRRMTEADFSDRPQTFVNLNSPDEKSAYEANRPPAG